MAATESDKGERWGRWHARDRTRAGSAASNAFMQRQYDETQRRLMALAALRAGERVLDLGAGVGMLTAAARAEVGESGRVVSLDVSADALRQIPAQGGEGEAPVLPVAGCLPAIPIADASVDVALSRSVLIYVPDKRAAAREAARVLRPGGRIAIYEPINRPSLPLCDWGLDFGPLRADHERVLAHLDATWQDREATVGFDERDLEAALVEAGFRSVRLEYEQSHIRGVRAPGLYKGFLRNRATGTMLSYEEAAEAVLGAGPAADHMAAFDRIADEQAGTVVLASAWLVAQKA